MLTYSLITAIVIGIIAQKWKQTLGVLWAIAHFMLSLILYFVIYFSVGDMVLSGETIIEVVYFMALMMSAIPIIIFLFFLPDRKVQESDRLIKARDFVETANREKYKGNNESALDNYQNAMYEIDQILVDGNSYDKREAIDLRDIIESSSSVESSIPQEVKTAKTAKTSPPRKINIKVLASIIIAIILLLVFAKQIRSILPQDYINYTKGEVVYNDNMNGEVKQVKKYLLGTLPKSSSYESIDWGSVEVNPSKEYKYMVRHKYRAENGLGEIEEKTEYFYLNADGKIKQIREVKIKGN